MAVSLVKAGVATLASTPARARINYVHPDRPARARINYVHPDRHGRHRTGTVVVDITGDAHVSVVALAPSALDDRTVWSGWPASATGYGRHGFTGSHSGAGYLMCACDIQCYDNGAPVAHTATAHAWDI